MDYVMREGYSWLKRFGASPGTMQLVSHETFRNLVESSSGYSVLPGGSGANTARALALLLGDDVSRLGRIAYSGGIGDDDPGRRFEAVLRELGIEPGLAVKQDAHTGVSAIVVTPDHERTMFTLLGACRDYTSEDLRLDLLRESSYFYSTGYMWDTEPQERALKQAVEEAQGGGKTVCFDLADPFVVDRYFEKLREWIRGRVDVLFANRQELSRMTGCEGSDIEIIRNAERLAPIIAMKIGKGGCIVLGGGKLIHVPGERVSAYDTTGAGDSFAAGFLYGLLEDYDLETCGRLGNRIASRIVTVEGCRYDLLDRNEILTVLQT